MAKKNHKKFLPKAGSTLAVAVAMTVALSSQVQATELDETENLNTGNPSVDTNESNVILGTSEINPEEFNEEVEQENKETIIENQETVENNAQTDLNNENAAQNNETITEGELVSPDLDLPDAPQIPDTEGMDVEDENAANRDYNEQVDEYEEAVDEYNGKVDEYNKDAEEFEKSDEQRYEEEKEAYDKAEEQHTEAEEKYEADLEQQEKNDAAYEEYQQEKEAYDQANSEYQESLDQYEESLNQGTADSDAREQYLQDKEAYDKAHADYLAALEKYQTAVPEHDPGSEEYQQYLQDKAAYDEACAEYLASLEKYNTEVLPQYEEDSAEYKQYLQDKAAYDAAYAEYLEKLYDYNQNELPGYQDKVEQSEKEKEIIEDVNQYNQEVKDKNDQIQKDNEELANNLDVGVVESLEDVKEINNNVKVDNDIMETLLSFDTLKGKQQELQDAGDALANHPGKGAELGSEEYAAYLKAVEDHNKAVDKFNEQVAGYNAAVAAYNEAVDDFNDKKESSSESSTGTGTSQGSASIDWGNVAINDDTVGHVDVKYQAAASKDVTIENGKPTYSNTVTQYEVTGVYTDETTAAGGTSTDYGLNFDNDGPGEQEPGTQELHKDAGYAEFGSDHFGFNQPSYDKVEELDTSKTYYISSGYGNNYQEIKYDAATGEWKTTGRYGQTVDVNDRSVYEKNEKDNVAINPATGTVSFYVTLDDGEETHGINVNLNAGSVYADGSFYKAKFDSKGNETDFLNQYVSSTGATIPVIWIENEEGVKEKYYNISGQSVFLISALTCDGMRNGDNGKLNPDGLDLILNLQTMIEVHQSASAKKLGYMGYELEKYKAVDEQNLSDPGQRPEAPTFEGNFGGSKEDPGKRPEAPTYDPGVFNMDKPKEAIKVERLNYISGLEKLGEKVVIVVEDPVDIIENDPVDILENDPVEVDDAFEVDFDFDYEIDFEVEIPDEEVPLAAAPETGDISALWGILSGFSAAGMFLLGRKRKDAE